MGKTVTLKALGLNTNANQLELPEGTLVQADNVLLRRDNVLEPDRGVSSYATHVAKRLAPYRDGLVSHSSTGTISYDSAGSFTANTGTYLPPDATTAKTRFAAAAQNLYFTTSTGVYRKDSLSATPALSGAVKPVGFDRARVATSAIGSMSLSSNVVSVTTAAAHGYTVGQAITQTSGTEAPYAAGNYTVATVPNSTSFTYALTAGDDAANANAHTFEPTTLITSGGFLADGSQVAYRHTFNCPDSNNTEKESASSPRTVIANVTGVTGWASGESKNVVLRVLIPSGITTSHRVRLFRSKQVDSGIEPEDEVGQVWESLVKAGDITAGYVDITDVVPDALRGATLYASPSQEGLAQANERPPLAKDLTPFGGSMHYANTTGLHRLVVNLLAVGGSNGIQDQDLFLIDGQDYRAVTGTPTALQFKIETGGTDAQDIRNTALNLCAMVNRNTGSDTSAFYISGADDLPGKILFERKALGGGSWRMSTDGKRTAWSPVLDPYGSYGFDLSRTGSVVTATVLVASDHNFLVGESVTLTVGDEDFPPGAKTITAVTSTTFTYAEAGDATTLASQAFTATVTLTSTADAAPHRVYHSKTNQPEAVPLLNYNDLGSKDADLLRIIALRDSIFAFKEDGLFRGTGSNGSFEWQLFDPTIVLLAPDTVVTLANRIYALTTQGVLAISDTGSEIVSRDIEKTLLDLQALSLANLKNLSFGVARETDHIYELRLPTLAGDTLPTQGYLLNVLANEGRGGWTRDTRSAWCGIQNPADDKRYLGGAAAVLKERKDFAYTDYSDADLAVTIDSIDLDGEVNLTSATGVTVGDILTDGTNSVRITAIASDDLTVADEDIATLASMSAGAATVKTGISVAVKYAPITGGDPSSQKLFQESVFLFGNAHVPAVTLGYTSDLVSANDGATANLVSLAGQWTTAGTTWDKTERPYNLRVPVPQSLRRAARLNVSLSSRFAWAAWNLSGLSVTYAGGSGRVSK